MFRRLTQSKGKDKKQSFFLGFVKAFLNKEIKAQYFLMNTWFFSDVLITALNEQSLESICIIKKNIKFAIVGETQKKILSRFYLSYISDVILHKLSAQALFRLRLRWSLLGTETIERVYYTVFLSYQTIFRKTVKYYSRRWSIERCFNSAKQYLGLDSVYFTRDYDSITALNRIAFIRLTVMEIIKRHQHDPRSHGQLFRDSCYEIKIILLLMRLNH